MKNSTAAAAIAGSIFIGFLIALAGSSGSVDLGPFPLFAVCGLLSYAINWAIFVPSYLARTEHYFDLAGSITYLTLTATALVFSELDSRAFLVAGMVAVWALRLGTFLFRRIKNDGKDGRFDDLKTNPVRFAMVWSLQGLWVYLTLAAALAAITGSKGTPLGIWAFIGTVVWLAGFSIEVVADRQKSAFRTDESNAGRFITKGLWAWSRHPNYFGEITLWVGIALIALPTLSGWRFVTLISPVFVYVLLTRISGIPLLERRAKKRWGHEEEFQVYKSQTPALMLRPPRT